MRKRKVVSKKLFPKSKDSAVNCLRYAKMRILCGKFQRYNLKCAIIYFVITPRSYSCNRLCCTHHSRRRRGCEVSHYEYASFGDMILTFGELASELGISSQPWMSRAYLSPLMAQGYIAQTLPKKPKSPLQRYRLLRKGKDVLA